MKIGTRFREALFLTGMAIAALASGATAPTAPIVLDEIKVEGAKERERERSPVININPTYTISARHKGITEIEVQLPGVSQPEIHFRRSSAARQLATDSANARSCGHDVELYDDRVVTKGKCKRLVSVGLTLAANVDEADGLPASIPFGPKASLVNLDYLRLRDMQGESGISLSFAIHPQTRRCDAGILLVDEGKDYPNRFVLLADSSVECRRIERSREGDLVFADGVPEPLRQAVLELYEPMATRLANRLGSEPGMVFVAWWPDSPHEGYRFEQSWNRNSLLLFNGTAGQRGLDPQQKEELQALFAAELVQRRIRQTDWPGPFTESGARYLLKLFNAEQADDTRGWLTGSLPGWVAGCAGDLRDRARTAAARGGVSSIDCGLVVQFVYDAVARARSDGSDNVYGTWRRLLGESYRRGKSGTKPATFLASSEQARRITQGLLDGTVDWARFAADLDGLGVRLRVNQDAPRPAVTVLALEHFGD